MLCFIVSLKFDVVILFSKMDILHYFLILLLVAYHYINNSNNYRKYYMPFISKLNRQIILGIKKNGPKIRNFIVYYFPFIPMQKLDRRSDLFSTITNTNLKKNQQLGSWKYSCGVLNLKSSLNIGTIYRSGCLLGMNKFVLFGSKQNYDKRSSVGLTYVDVEYVNIFTKIPDNYDSSIMTLFDENILIQFIKQNKYIPIIIEQNGTNIFNVDFHKMESDIQHGFKYLFLFGNETFGFSKKLIMTLFKNFPNAQIISIPQWGCPHSYNVSQAANIVMWEYFRANYKKMYAAYTT